MGHVAQLVGFGVVDAAVLGIAAVAFTLQFGVTNYFNFAYGEFLTFGAFVALFANVDHFQLNIWACMLVAGIVTAGLAFVTNRAIFAPFVKRRPEPFLILVVTFGAGLLLNSIYQIFWGTDYHELSFTTGNYHSLGPFQFTTDQLFFLLIAIAFMVGLQMLLTLTKLGRMMRAIADDRALAVACGLSLVRVTDITWLLTGFMAGVAGVIFAMQNYAFSIALGDNYTYLVFPAVIIGGIGQPRGALIGAMIIGIVIAVSPLVLSPALSPILVFGALIAVVLLRPRGLLGIVTHGHMQEL